MIPMIDHSTLSFIREHTDADVRTLILQASRYPNVDMHVAAIQIEGHRMALHKLPSWASVEGIVYPPRLSMEQCSSEVTACYKASLVGGKRLADLTGGFGIDCSYMSESFDKTIYVERSEELCNIASHNFALLGKSIQVINGNSEEILATLPEQDWIFIDPARRSKSGGKVVALGDCEPNVCQLENLLLQKATHVMVKCSPMLDISLAVEQLHSVKEVHVVSVNNECKELLLVLGRDVVDGVYIHSVNFQGDCIQTFLHTFSEEVGTACTYTSQLSRYLYEPNSSLMKAGCFRLPAMRYGLSKLHPNTHLYTSDQWVETFPGRVFEIEEVYGFGKKELKRLISEAPKGNLAVRNFPSTPEELRKRMKLTDGGDIYLFATTLNDNSKVLVRCCKAHK
jgi:16S rRNA G966 N2-methylase RsmD